MASKAGIALKLLIVGVVLAIAAVAALNYAQVTVGVKPAHRGVAVDEIFGVVSVLPKGGTIPLSSDYAGTVLESKLESNRKVAAGEVLLALDTSDVNLQIDAKNIDLTEAIRLVEQKSSAAFKLESAEQSQMKLLAQKKSGGVTLDEEKIAQRAVDEAKTAKETEERLRANNVAKLENELAKLALQKKRMTIDAPIAGTITKAGPQKNTQIQAGLVGEMISNDRLVQQKIPGESYSKVKIGQDAKVTLSTYGGKEFNAKVIQVGASPDPETHRYLVDLDVTDIPKDQLVAGLEGDARIIVGQKPNAILVPRFSLNGTKIQVVSNGRIQLRSVQVGLSNATETEILSGVQEGELVVVEQSGTLREGDRVKVEEAKDK